MGPVLNDIGQSWPSPQALASQAHRIRQESEVFREGLRNALPWIPQVISQMYPDSPEHRARLALLFWHVVRILNDPWLTATQAHLERLAYHSLCDVYEEEPQDSNRLQAVQQAWRQTFRAWYAILTDPNRTWVFEPDAPRQRETAMWEALTLKSTRGRRLRRFFRETRSGQETVRRLIERWFLPRYDLAGAERLKTALRAAARDPAAGGYLGDLPWLGARGLSWSRRFMLVVLVAYVLVGWQPVWNRVEQGGWAPWGPLIMAAVYLLGGLPPLLFWLTSGRPDTSTPRLWAGILVAVVGTMMQQNWERMMAFAHTRVVALWVLWVFLLAAAYRVLLVKVRQTTEFEGVMPEESGLRSPRKWLTSLWHDAAHWRCMDVGWRGLTLAFLISLLVTDMFGDSYLAGMDPAQIDHLSRASPLVWHLPGLIGHTFPALVILFTALTLFTGVFVQLLGEERPITEGLA